MFGVGPPPPSAAEIREQEREAKNAIQGAVKTCILLYLSPFVVDYVKSFL
ncbi:unnamed protein product [Tuber melanosporum]|jgi:hypothetical protein|uniref:(Perigord truffle) hypothetical protein n=1 Tax=Tuber melanosporum (strain Mel28) TaxID=656061 RepID=D5GKA8_TUBMM|nr:uncharacterized protein GSTUM_00009452001 [Tuber melanosporum]CAZ84951.1 unnamed protein product [Tuber melanosporum]